MDLIDFLRETQATVRSQMQGGELYEELVFTGIVMEHMSEIGMTFEPVECHYEGKVGNANLRLSGYSVSEDSDQLDLFVSLYANVETPTSIPDSETGSAAEKCLRFLALCAEGKMASKLDPSSDVRSLAETLHGIYNDLEQIRIYVITDKVAKSKSFKTRDIGGKAVRLEVMDIERLHRHWSEGKPRDELVVDFSEVSGSPLPCVFVPRENDDYDYALTAIPGEALRLLYEKFGARLLEANVRSFLSTKGKGVNAGIQTTLRSAPERFMAYNNGIVIVVDEMRLGKPGDGSTGISWLKGLQIVNGGQTTASLYFTKKKYPDTDLSHVRVAAKIIVMKTEDAIKEESLVSDISRFANSQNVVKQSDLSANKPFHVEIEKLSRSVYCPDGVGQWFYERAAGSYNTLLAREGTTPAKLKALKDAIPAARRITKTDLAKYITAWDKRPDIVGLGSQKNFDKFMASLTPADGQEAPLPTVADFKAMIAKAKIYREAQKRLRPMYQAFQANVTAYTVALLSEKFGNRIDLDRIWVKQSVSSELLSQIAVWSKEVNDVLHESAGGRMVSEWAKRPECKEAVMGASYSVAASNIPEVKPK
ncbi:AIPR family protein [Verminephrobacter eiseniae]|uniref:AIPR family protein n=1 Tax=Verminephrobacter eiseniae TaxID=364317 RepID=UPI002237576E|nr:AIPR family protein [Verminephrobacter eiseniae]MCW5233412.1 abortive phage infection protein [Verminephrobacter eiseniae]MCW5295035.1 abortive phage infection protein [Verminephrobacter eiseniae]MCW8186072.1 abortive phage infection protein [Verminephrobacter eiseniae]MCW8224916.1 abortive phage infection protein [Verminephrobacter eiseniae]MCW8235966.1 abortive phage infection protein [Verminephrobacter eiseniae]